MNVRIRMNVDWLVKTGVMGLHDRLGLIMKKPMLVIRDEIAVQWWDQQERRQPLFYLRTPLEQFEKDVGDPVTMSVVHLGSLNNWPLKKDSLAKNLWRQNPEGHAIYAIGNRKISHDGEQTNFPFRVVAEILPLHDEQMGTLFPKHYRHDKFVREIERELFGR